MNKQRDFFQPFAYPEHTAKVHNFPKENLVSLAADRKRNIPFPDVADVIKELKYADCSKGFIIGKCDGGHSHAKVILCGKEWCKTCGEKNSDAHKRRVARWWEKALSMKTMGYLIVTVPENMRDAFMSKKVCNEFRTFLIRKLQREMNVVNGLSRWHWCGEDGKTFKPHLNFLFEFEFWEKPKMVKFRKDVAAWLRRKFKMSASGNIRYRYAKPNAKKIHWLKYVTRATMREYNNRFANEFFGYRTAQSWGTWLNIEPVETESLEQDLIKAMSGICPCCNLPITWGKFLTVWQFDLLFKQHKKQKIPGGYIVMTECNN